MVKRHVLFVFQTPTSPITFQPEKHVKRINLHRLLKMRMWCPGNEPPILLFLLFLLRTLFYFCCLLVYSLSSVKKEFARLGRRGPEEAPIKISPFDLLGYGFLITANYFSILPRNVCRMMKVLLFGCCAK